MKLDKSTQMLITFLEGILPIKTYMVGIVDIKGNFNYETIINRPEQKKSTESYNTIFQVNPGLNLITWRKYYHRAKEEEYISFSTQVLFHSDIIEEATVHLFVPSWSDKDSIIYLIERDEKNLSITSSSKNPISSDPSLNEISKFQSDIPTWYCKPTGDIIQENKGASIINTKRKKQISGLFLETDFGTFPQMLSRMQSDQIKIVDLIYKTDGGFIKGLGIICYTEEIKSFQIQFLPQNNLLSYANPLTQLELPVESQDFLEIELDEYLIHPSTHFSLDDIVTRSSNYKKVLEKVAIVADRKTTVLITGETGTGKELLSDAIHRLSDRYEKPFIKLNCATIPENLIESELFGHEKGAFTGADKMKIGQFEAANDGTIFLDEIGELPLRLQAKLLRVLQEEKFTRIGSTKVIDVDIRVIAATNKDLRKMVKKGKFRADLYYRLNVFEIENIPLRERKKDIPYLIEHFILKMNKKLNKKVSRVKSSDVRTLTEYDYPGNVRELQNIIERSLVLTQGKTLNLDMDLRGTQSNFTSGFKIVSLEENQVQHIKKALRLSKGKISGKNSAAEILQINAKTLASKMRKFDIKPYQEK